MAKTTIMRIENFDPVSGGYQCVEMIRDHDGWKETQARFRAFEINSNQYLEPGEKRYFANLEESSGEWVFDGNN